MASERKIRSVQKRAAAVSKSLQQGAMQSPLGAPSRSAQRGAPAAAPKAAKQPVAPPAAAFAPIGKSMTADDLLRMQNAVDAPPMAQPMAQPGAADPAAAAAPAAKTPRVIQGPNGLQVVYD